MLPDIVRVCQVCSGGVILGHQVFREKSDMLRPFLGVFECRQTLFGFVRSRPLLFLVIDCCLMSSDIVIHHLCCWTLSGFIDHCWPSSCIIRCPQVSSDVADVVRCIQEVLALVIGHCWVSSGCWVSSDFSRCPLVLLNIAGRCQGLSGVFRRCQSLIVGHCWVESDIGRCPWMCLDICLWKVIIRCPQTFWSILGCFQGSWRWQVTLIAESKCFLGLSLDGEWGPGL